MKCMSMPEKFLSMGSFYKYYSGEKVAPIPTLFIHGNHECVNYLKELYFGGWVAPNIYYMGYSGVINFGGVRIGGLSGIYSDHDYRKGHCERPPYRGGAGKSAYHVREYEVFKLSQIKEPMDICLSHDWPTGIYHYGDKQRLIQKKPFFEAEIARDELGSVAAQFVMLRLKPRYWFSAHLHVKFAALFTHPGPGEPQLTRFLALDKCLPGRDFMQILDIEPQDPESKLAGRDAFGKYRFHYDEEWLAILKSTTHIYSSEMAQNYLPEVVPVQEARDKLRADGLVTNSAESLLVPLNFQAIAPAYNPQNPHAPSGRMAPPFGNPQTTEFAATYGITLPVVTEHVHHGGNQQYGDTSMQVSENRPEPSYTNDGAANPDEIELGDE